MLATWVSVVSLVRQSDETRLNLTLRLKVATLRRTHGLPSLTVGPKQCLASPENMAVVARAWQLSSKNFGKLASTVAPTSHLTSWNKPRPR